MELIHSYTRAQAIEDGFLVDVTEAAKEAGFTIPVALTRAVWVDCVEWDEDTQRRKGAIQDESGRLWDVVYMALLAARQHKQSGPCTFQLYRVPVNGKGYRARLVTLQMHLGGGDSGEPVITIGQPDED